MEMTHEEVVRICKAAGYYSTPELNEKLYLQCKGFDEIKGLEEFVNAKALWLEGNCIGEIKGLDNNTELMCLYMGRNMVDRIGGVGHLKKLKKLDLSNNMIRDIENLEGCTDLTELNLSKNQIQTARGLLKAPPVTTLDLSHNRIASADELLPYLERSPQILSLRLMGNPVVRVVPYYRTKIISILPNLRSLDDTPVSDVDKEAALAFFEGGVEAEQRVRADARAKVQAERERQMQHFESIIEEARKKRGTPLPHTEYYVTNVINSSPHTRPSAEEAVNEVFAANTFRPPSPASDWSTSDYDSSDGGHESPTAPSYNDIHRENAARESAWAQGKEHKEETKHHDPTRQEGFEELD
eukprot:TRINITY_DN43457_c0_g1_i1.p1 TRINITY_DN43457_c0_g1~~TRINITY_DN43457_c0_g1_i1.p1  ORF type:complete len:355 (+),score=117.38 TRINITY_DN43457_c0_g1_i1:50-1114(+)